MKPPRKAQERKFTKAARGKPQSTNAREQPSTTVKEEGEAGASNLGNKLSYGTPHAAPLEASSNRIIPEKDGADSDEEQKKYSRRSIACNWNRYEDPQDCDDLAEDFVTTKEHLSSKITAGDVTSQFRFRDELEWEDGGDSEYLSDFQKLNLDDLAFSLACIPLYERLNIASNVFPADSITEFQDEAHANRQIFHKQKHQESTAKPDVSLSNPSYQSFDQTANRSIIFAHVDKQDELELTKTAVTDTTAREEIDTNDATTCETFEDELNVLLSISAQSDHTNWLSTGQEALPSPIVLTAETGPSKTISTSSNLGLQLHKQNLDDDWLDDLLDD